MNEPPIAANLDERSIRLMSLGIVLIVALAMVVCVYYAVTDLSSPPYGHCLEMCQSFGGPDTKLDCMKSCNQLAGCVR